MSQREAKSSRTPLPHESARQARLRYVNDGEPGIRRLRKGSGFYYVTAEGRPVRAVKTLARIRRLAIPPAWTDVWICGNDQGHLQAVGRDARGRKQYRYHASWREVRDQSKYGRLVGFARALPRMRQAIRRHMRLPGMPKQKVLAAIVRLLQTTLIRVGNQEYQRQNGSFGLTTLQDRHVEVGRQRTRFCFKGKGGIRHCIDLQDTRLARIIRQCQELPGQHLFQYVSDDGTQQAIASADVNAYLKEISGEDFTAKDFRTWAGTVLAAQALQELIQYESETQAKRNVVSAVEVVAKRLGNTKAICRKCYIHPEIINAYLEGSLVSIQITSVTQAVAATQLSHAEKAVLAFLRRRLRPAGRSSAAPIRRAS